MANQPISVLVQASFPGQRGMGEVDPRVKINGHGLVIRELPAVSNGNVWARYCIECQPSFSLGT